MVTLLEHKILIMAARRKQSDSILEIMNTREIEQMLAERERRLNNSSNSSSNNNNDNNNGGGSRDDGNQLIIQNDLDEDFTELLPRTDRYHNHQHQHQHRRQQHERQQHHHQHQHQHQQSNSKEIGIDFEYPGINNDNDNNNNRKRNRENQQEFSDSVLMPYNDSQFSSENGNSRVSSSSSSHTSELSPLVTESSSFVGTSGTAGIDLQDLKGDKILKSSKNALYITRKEYLKKDWCKTEPLIQRIREPGCLTRTFINRFCYGQCNSFYIPKSPKRKRNNSQTISRYIEQDHFEDEDLTPAAFRSCGFCKPKKFTWITVTLRCPSLVPQLRKKRVQRIKQCRCMAEPLD